MSHRGTVKSFQGLERFAFKNTLPNANDGPKPLKLYGYSGAGCALNFANRVSILVTIKGGQSGTPIL